MFLKKISVLLISSLSFSFAMQGAALESEAEAKRQKETREIQIPATPLHPSTQPRSVLAEALAAAKSEALFKEGDWKILERVIGRVEGILEKYSPEVIREVSKKVEAESKAAEEQLEAIKIKNTQESIAISPKKLRGFIAMGIKPPVEAESITVSSTRADMFTSAILQESEGLKTSDLPHSPGIGLSSAPTTPTPSRPHDEHELKRLAEWDTDIELLDDSTVDSVLSESMSGSSRIKQLVNQWEKTPGKDEYDFETEAQAKAACKRLRRYIILEGAPGTGKSILAKAIAQKCKMKIFSKGGSSIADSYVNSGDVDLRNIFAKASALRKKCAIIVDEIDYIFSCHNKKTESSDHDGGMTTTLWTLLDKYETKPILFIGTANDTSKLPPAIRSRFEGRISHISPLASIERLENLIKSYMEELGDITDSSIAKKIAPKTLGFSQRRVKRLVELALDSYFCLKKEEQFENGKRNDKVLEKCFDEAFKDLSKSYDPEKSFGDRVCDFTAKYGNTIGVAVNVAGLGISGYNTYQSEQHRQEDVIFRREDREEHRRMREEDRKEQAEKNSVTGQVKSAAIQSGTQAAIAVVAAIAGEGLKRLLFSPIPVPAPVPL